MGRLGFPFLGQPSIEHSNLVKFWFADVGLSMSDLSWG